MKWSFRIGSYAGIGVYVHATFLLLIGWVVVSHYMRDRSVAAALEGGAFISALFGCVLLHEFGHALTAKRYGIATRDITLLPIGGLARLERMPDDPRQELWVALAGPAVNVVIAAVILGGLALSGERPAWESMTVASGGFAARMAAVNVVLAVFNLLPAFPMDGGRVLRALLAMRMDYNQATQTAAAVGQGMAFLFGFIGLFANPLLLFIALFVWMGATQEANMTSVRTALGGLPTRSAMMTRFHVLRADDPLTRAIELVLADSQHDFPVLEGDRLVGVLTRDRLFAALAGGGQTQRVAEAMVTDVRTTHPGEMLEIAFQRLQDSPCRVMPVLQNGELVGLLTLENVGEFLGIQAALDRRAGRTRTISGIPGAGEPRPAETIWRNQP